MEKVIRQDVNETLNFLADAFASVEVHDVIVEMIFLNPKQIQDLSDSDFLPISSISDRPETQTPYLLDDDILIGQLWNSWVFTRESVHLNSAVLWGSDQREWSYIK